VTDRTDPVAPARILLLGSPGAGKSTIAARLAQRLGSIHLSTGALLRRAMDRPAPLGDAVRPYVERGDLVPDDLILAVVAAALPAPDVVEHGYVLDGFPRTVEQAEAFLAQHPDGIDVTVELRVPRDEARRRLVARGRADDDPAVVERRLDAYEAETGPLRRFLRGKRPLVDVDGIGPPAEVLDRVCAAIAGPSR
jgi:adenylate kinase